MREGVFFSSLFKKKGVAPIWPSGTDNSRGICDPHERFFFFFAGEVLSSICSLLETPWVLRATWQITPGSLHLIIHISARLGEEVHETKYVIICQRCSHPIFFLIPSFPPCSNDLNVIYIRHVDRRGSGPWRGVCWPPSPSNLFSEAINQEQWKTPLCFVVCQPGRKSRLGQQSPATMTEIREMTSREWISQPRPAAQYIIPPTLFQFIFVSQMLMTWTPKKKKKRQRQRLR